MQKLLFLFLLLMQLTGKAQNGYRIGDTIKNIAINKALNSTSKLSSLNSLKGTVTIIDFFGTWCIPCIKAIPELKKFKEKFKNNLNVILISTEDEVKLTKFIAAHKPFDLPIVVDADTNITNAFQPLAYPYTVVLNKDLTIASISNEANLTQIMVQNFIDNNSEKIDTTTILEKPSGMPKTNNSTPAFTESNNLLIKLSQDFVYAAKTNADATTYINQLRNLPYQKLVSELKNDEEKKAFWINLYNAYVNTTLHQNPSLYKMRNLFFKNKNIVVAGKVFSLDKIEHGLLRKSKIKWSLGYLNKLFPNKVEKELRVQALDYRIHFALNCGAKSCPPIAFYNPENINNQLDVATRAYLGSEVVYNVENNSLYLPAILGWFRRDFGGKNRIITLLKGKKMLAQNTSPKIKFKKYDWTLFLEIFKK